LMQRFGGTRSEVSQILDHRMLPVGLNGREIHLMHLQLEWSDASSIDDRFSWEPLSRIHKDVPDMVRDYFTFAKLDLAKVLEDESNRRC